MTLFTAIGVGVAAGGQRLPGDISFELEPGELVALVGPSGSGKTTLLRALALLSDPATGEVRLHGRTPAEHGYPEWRRKVALVAQRPVLLDAGVGENLARAFTYKTARAPFDDARARALLEKLGLGAERWTQNATTLSEGQQQRVSLARTLLVEPAVLLLDEPTAALDPTALEATETLVRAHVRDTGAAALVVTHDHAQAARWCDRTLTLAVDPPAALGPGPSAQSPGGEGA